MKKIYLWKALRTNLKSHYGKHKFKIRKWYKAKGELSMCSNGFHASERIADSMQYVPMEVLAKVEVRGKHEKQSDKQCWEEMRIIKAWKWEKTDSVALSIYAASLVLENFEKRYPNDKRPREAIRAARTWLKKPTKKNQAATETAARAADSAADQATDPADSAARTAAWAAAWAARAVTATGAAARTIWSAADTAARAAAWAVTATGAAAILNKCENWIKRRINKLEEIEQS